MLPHISFKNQEFESIVSPEAALARGSSFNNLYRPYKFETNKILKGQNPRQNMLALIDIYSFLITDLMMYLDTHPENEKVKHLIHTLRMELKKLKDYYNTNFTPLTMDCESMESYQKGPWPWEDRF